MEGSMAGAFDAYVEALTEVIGHADRAEPLRDYCTGLMMPADSQTKCKCQSNTGICIEVDEWLPTTST